MKKTRLFLRAFCATALVTTFLNGCVKDKITYTYQLRTPIYQPLAAFRASVKSQPATDIPGMGKIAVSGNYIFVSELYKGIHVIDNSNPASPKNVSFINLPGNEDMAITGNTLYADSYGDLVTFDITNPTNAIAKNFATNVFPDHAVYGGTDQQNVIIGWNTRDTTVDYSLAGGRWYIYPVDCINCETVFAASTPPAATGAKAQSGSLSRFAVLNKYLYTVSSENLTPFDISAPLAPSMQTPFLVDYHVETIYPFKNNLFVGTNNGVYMYDAAASPSKPVLLGEFTHARGCDPVVADGNYAYVTINDSSACLGFNNELQIVDVHDLSSASVATTYQLTHPDGLAKDGNTLFICDGKGGLKVYDATNPTSLRLIKQLNDADVYDVIAQNGVAIVAAATGIYQYSYSNLNNIHLLSKL